MIEAVINGVMGESVSVNWWAAMFCLGVMGTTDNETLAWIALVAFALNVVAWVRSI